MNSIIQNMENNHFRIANLDITIRFADTSVNNMTLLPSFIPFRMEEEATKPLFTLTVDDSTRPVKQKSSATADAPSMATGACAPSV